MVRNPGACWPNPREGTVHAGRSLHFAVLLNMDVNTKNAWE